MGFQLQEAYTALASFSVETIPPPLLFSRKRGGWGQLVLVSCDSQTAGQPQRFYRLLGLCIVAQGRYSRYTVILVTYVETRIVGLGVTLSP